jgi:hypothetical protein
MILCCLFMAVSHGNRWARGKCSVMSSKGKLRKLRETHASGSLLPPQISNDFAQDGTSLLAVRS